MTYADINFIPYEWEGNFDTFERGIQFRKAFNLDHFDQQDDMKVLMLMSSESSVTESFIEGFLGKSISHDPDSWSKKYQYYGMPYNTKKNWEEKIEIVENRIKNSSEPNQSPDS